MRSASTPYDPGEPASRVVQELLEESRFAYLQLATDLEVTWVSENFHQLVGAVGTNGLGQPVGDLIWELVGAESALAELLDGLSGEYRLERVNRRLPDGTLRYLDFRVVRLDRDRPEAGLLVLIEDTTREGQLEQHLIQERNDLRLAEAQLAQANEDLQHLNQLKSLFLSMAAHDLRSPLTAIYALAELLLLQIPADAVKASEFAKSIQVQADRLQRLIADLLDLDRIQQAKLVLRPADCTLDGIVAEVVEALEVVSQQRQIEMIVDLPDEPLPIWAERERIAQVVYNLVSNAQKYTPSGGRVRISAFQSGAEVILQVADNGMGMSEAERAQLFHLYYRTEGARRSQAAGAGLGLFIVKALVEAHRGQVAVQSQPGQGAIFTVRLPAPEIAMEVRVGG